MVSIVMLSVIVPTFVGWLFADLGYLVLGFGL